MVKFKKRTCDHCKCDFTPTGAKSVMCSAMCRFNSKVIRHKDGCWEWTGSVNSSGYGSVFLNGSLIGAHVFSYITFVGKVAAGQMVLHSCDNPKCVNPKHLSVGNQKDNMKDMKDRNRRSYPCGQDCKTSKLSDDSVAQILERAGNGECLQSIANTFNVDRTTVLSAIKRNTWKCVDVNWSSAFEMYRQRKFRRLLLKHKREFVQEMQEMISNGMATKCVCRLFSVEPRLLRKFLSEAVA